MRWWKACYLNAMVERLQSLRGVLLSGGTLTKADKQWVKDTYLKIVGKVLTTSRGCSSCWSDAIIHLLTLLRTDGLKMRSGAVVHYEGKVYNKHTITQDIAKRVIAQNPELKHLFY